MPWIENVSAELMKAAGEKGLLLMYVDMVRKIVTRTLIAISSCNNFKESHDSSEHNENNEEQGLNISNQY